MQNLLKGWRSTSLRAIRKCLSLSVVVCSVSVVAASADTTTCDVSRSSAKDGKALCVRAASILLPQPRLTPTQIANGPDFDPAHPDRSRFAYFTEADSLSLRALAEALGTLAAKLTDAQVQQALAVAMSSLAAMRVQECIRHDDKIVSRLAPQGDDGGFDLYVAMKGRRTPLAGVSRGYNCASVA